MQITKLLLIRPIKELKFLIFQTISYRSHVRPKNGVVVNEKSDEKMFNNLAFYNIFNIFDLIKYLPLFIKVSEINRNKF